MYYEQIFEEMKELQEKKSKEALLLVRKTHFDAISKWERDKARMLQRSGTSRVTSRVVDTQDLLPFVSCRSSVVDDMEAVSSESSRKMQDEEDTTLEALRAAVTGRKDKDKEGWRLEPGGETETPEVIVLWNEAEGVPENPIGEGHHERAQLKSSRRESEAPGEEVEEVRSPERRMIRVESEETQDYVREAMDLSQEEAEEVSFVPSAISVPPKPLFSVWQSV